jgi:hypothetical protein
MVLRNGLYPELYLLVDKTSGSGIAPNWGLSLLCKMYSFCIVYSYWLEDGSLSHSLSKIKTER